MSGHLVHDLVQLNVVVGLPRNNQRRARFVNQDAVHFVHHGEVELALDFVVDVVHHVVAQVVKAEFVVRAVGDVAAVGLLAVERIHVAQNNAHAQSEEVVKRTHDARVALGKVVVHGYHVRAFARQGVEINGERADEGFAFACAHFGDFAVVQHHAADELNVKMAHAQHAH